MRKKIRAGALISGGGSNLQAIIDAAAQGRIDAEILFAGADNLDSKGLIRARKAGIETFVVDYKRLIQRYKKNPDRGSLPEDFDLEEICRKQNLIPESAGRAKIEQFLTTRAIAERALLDKILPHGIDLLILAGFMRTLTPYFIDRINTDRQRIMNIHPALLPAFPGVDGYGDTFRYGCRIGGCTVHFVDYGEDTGPILGQRAFAIDEDDTLENVKKKGLELEWELYPACIQDFAHKILG